mgnify:CR=1 FL=1
MNSKYEVIRQFVAAHGGRAELIEHETAIEDSYHTLAIDPTTPQRCTACMEFSDIRQAAVIQEPKLMSSCSITLQSVRACCFRR